MMREYRLTCHIPATEIDPPEDYAYPWRASLQRAVADARTDGPNARPRRIREIESREVSDAAEAVREASNG
jgi:hypothetical protein